MRWAFWVALALLWLPLKPAEAVEFSPRLCAGCLTQPSSGQIFAASNPRLSPAARAANAPVASETGYDPLAHQRVAMGILLTWSALSIASGIASLAIEPTHPWLGFGIQNIAWGAIDAAIGILSLALMKRSLPDLAALEKERLKFRTALFINALLDVVYVLVGVGMAIWGDAAVQGHGAGVIVQGGFLLLFDGIHALLTFS